MRRPRRLQLAGAAVVIATAVTGCSTDDEPDTPPPEIGGADTTDPTSPSGAAGGDTIGPPAKKGDTVADEYRVIGGDMPEAGQEARLARLVVDYMDARIASYHAAVLDPRVSSTATGQALTDVQGRTAELAQTGVHTVGEMIVHVAEVEVQAEHATLTGCLENGTVDVDADNVAVESPPAAYDMTFTALMTDGTWLIDTTEFAATKSC